MRTHPRAFLPIAALLAGSASHAETRLSADVFGGVGYSRNPFLVAGNGSGGSGTYDVGIRPRVDIVGPRSTFSLIGHATLQDYFNSLPNSNSFGASASYSTRATERLTLNASLAYDNSVIGAGGGFFEPGPVIGPVIPATPGADGATLPPIVLPPLPLPGLGTDLGFIGTRSRQKTYQANGGFAYALSARDSVNGGAFVSASRYGVATGFNGFGDYESYGANLGYQRQLNERLSVGAAGSYSRFDYGSLRGNTDASTIQATVNYRLSQFWSLSGALGVTFSSGDEFSGTSRALSGNLQACRAGERGQLCLLASRSVQPTGFAGTQRQTSLGANYSYRLDEVTNLRADVSYVESASVGQGPNPFANEFGRGTLGIDRRLSQRLFLDASVYYRRTVGGLVDFPDDYGGRIGVRYRFGDPR